MLGVAANPRSDPGPHGRARLFWAMVPAAAFVALLVVGLLRAPSAPALGGRAPEFSGRLLAGGELALADLDGKPILMNFWASWCVPCRDEAPLLQAGRRAYGDRVQFLGINIRDDIGDARRFVAQHRLAYPHIRDDDLAIYDDYGLTGQPETFLITSNGRVIEHISGPFLSRADLFQLLDRLVARGG